MLSKRLLLPTALRPHAIIRANLQRHQLLARRTNVHSSFDWKPIKGKDNDKPKPSVTRYIFLSLLIAMPLVTFYLGTWQLKRLKWKNNLIASSEDKLTYPPIPLPKKINPDDAEDLQYRRYLVTGKYDHSKEIFVGPKVRNGEKGYQVFTPLIRSDGGEPILIERGFITDENILPPRRKLKHLSLPMHEVTVEVILKKINEKSNLVLSKLDPDSRVWHVIDVPEMTEATGCAPIHVQALIDLKDYPVETKIVKEDKPWWKIWSRAQTHEETQLKKVDDPSDIQEFSPYQLLKAGVPLGRPASIDFRNNHLQYLATWYGLSFASSILLFLVFKKKPKVDPTKAKLEHAKRYT